MTPSRPVVAAIAAVAALGLAACTESASGGDGANTKVTVTSTDDTCELSATSATSGNVTFDVTNRGSQVTEFYLYEADGTAVVGEVENIGPGLTRPLTVDVAAGTYVTACKPGMTGDGIRGEFTVSTG
jgi:iron uptake system component EfeO